MSSLSSSAPRRPKAEILAELEQKISPVVLARDRTLPVPPVFSELLAAGGLVVGSTAKLSGTGATSVAMSMLSEASKQGAWMAMVGQDHFGLAAAVNAGLALERTLFIPSPPSGSWVELIAALVDSFDVVVFDPVSSTRERDARRLVARVRERDSVLIELAGSASLNRHRWPVQADHVLNCETERWEGLDEGAGTLGSRVISVSLAGRRGNAATRQLRFGAHGPESVDTVHHDPLKPVLRAV